MSNSRNLEKVLEKNFYFHILEHNALSDRKNNFWFVMTTFLIFIKEKNLGTFSVAKIATNGNKFGSKKFRNFLL